MHELFARYLAHSLDLYLGSSVELRLTKIEQMGSREFGAALPAGSYIVPLNLQPVQEKLLAKFDNGLLFPLLDLLLGGPGEPSQDARELTDIDEELFRSVVELIAGQLERVWKPANVSVMPLASVKPGLTGQMFALEERIVTLQFEVRVATATSGFTIAIPMSFAGNLVRSNQEDAIRRGESRLGEKERLRCRVLQGDIRVSVELSELGVSVSDILALRPGKVLNLRMPHGRPVMLSVNGLPMFEVLPVKRGQQKAAQLNRTIQLGG